MSSHSTFQFQLSKFLKYRTNRIVCFTSGDIGHLDEENFLFISDRAKEIIIRGGENISSIAVENAFYVDSRIKDAAVVPVKDDAMGELVALVISFIVSIIIAY